MPASNWEGLEIMVNNSSLSTQEKEKLCVEVRVAEAFCNCICTAIRSRQEPQTPENLKSPKDSR